MDYFHFKKLLIPINVDGGLKPKHFNEAINQEVIAAFFKCPHTKLSAGYKVSSGVIAPASGRQKHSQLGF